MFIVIELQTSGTQTANLVTSHTTLAEAEAKYHNVLAAAAVSSLDAHGAIMVNDRCVPIKHECYTHTAEE